MTAAQAYFDPIAAWHGFLQSRDIARLEALLADDVVFQSPAVHTPQRGKPVTIHYLRAAMEVLNNDSFRYVGEWRGERSAVLEFELELDGLFVNGVDLIRWNADGKIDGFKVMIRPLKGLNAVIPKMAALLSQPA